MPGWVARALASMVIAVGVAAISFGAATGLGWIAWSDGLEASEVGVGIPLLVGGAIASGFVHQLISSVELGPEILIGQAIILVAAIVVAIVGSEIRPYSLIFGGLFVAGATVRLCGVAARMTWTLSTTRRVD